MPAELHLARRYLVGLRRRTHIATVTLISMVGLALGVLALVVTLSLLEGFQASIREEIVARATHARVVPVQGRRLDQPQELAWFCRRSCQRWKWSRLCAEHAWFRRSKMPFRHL